MTDGLRELLILRHAKAQKDAGLRDYERALNERGTRDAPRVGIWLRNHGLRPDLVISSPALRARQTTLFTVLPLGLNGDEVRWEEELYLADLQALRELVAATPDPVRRLLLVGHNPGLEDLVLSLAGVEPGLPDNRLRTAALVHLALASDWQDLSPASARLLNYYRPAPPA